MVSLYKYHIDIAGKYLLTTRPVSRIPSSLLPFCLFLTLYLEGRKEREIKEIKKR